MVGVKAFEELTHVVVDEVVLKHRDNVRVLVVDYVIDDLDVVIVATRQVLALKVLLRHCK